LSVSGIKVSTLSAAASAISTIDTALKSVTTLRSNLGAYQNRLEFTINTLAIQEENSSAAESAIRDADIATETISFTRNQILVSAGTSVLAQANIVPQTALQLLK
jgi:flagellin